MPNFTLQNNPASLFTDLHSSRSMGNQSNGRLPNIYWASVDHVGGHPKSKIPYNASWESNRVDVLKLLLAALCHPIYYKLEDVKPDNNYFAQVFNVSFLIIEVNASPIVGIH